jgi:hypothetical protein
LYSRKDLPWRKRWSIGRHVASCEACSRQLSELRSSIAILRDHASSCTLSSFEAIADWPALESEMLANVRVGLDAARCIGPARRAALPGFRVALGVCALFLFAAAGWWMNIPREQTHHLADSLRRIAGMPVPPPPGSVVQTSPFGISVRTQGATLTMLSPTAAAVTVSLSGSSSVAASYVDDKTGQVTITNVYGQ